METIKVNMNPNPLDVQTIHASQNDGEARQWGFELHNNGELIDTSDVTDQIVFKAYKGGTEQLLPENGSVPVTSPFLGDIRYPQGLLTDQEFTYRQSPTEEDGLAFIEKIKGNTLVWNQLVQNGNFADTSAWTTNGCTLTVNGNIATIASNVIFARVFQRFNIVSGHKYLISFSVKKNNANDDIRLYYGTKVGGGHYPFANNTEWQTHTIIKTATETATDDYPSVTNASGTPTWYQKNCMFIDLTQMGLDISNPSDFTSLFSLPYYSYNQGSLLSFMGNGIKTVGKNLFDENLISQDANIVYSQIFVGDGTFVLSTTVPNIGQANVFLLSGYATSGASTANNGAWNGRTRQVTSLNGYVTVATRTAGTPLTNPKDYETILYKYNGETVSYEPYTSSTTSLPISTYFPTGMKSVPSAYDELTPSKAITRVGSVDLGTLTYAKEPPVSAHPDWPLFYASVPGALGKYSLNGNTQICAKYSNRGSINWNDKEIGFGGLSTNINIADTAFADYTVEQVKEALSGVMLYYKLATQTETSFSTASLVTENAEIPLSNEDGVLIGKCTEQLSSESGFFDAKIKLADEDGECYSNKIQLHVERKPS